MTQRKNINRSTVLDVTPAGSAISEKSRLEESAVPVRSMHPRYPLVISTRIFVPVVMGPCGFWSKALIETMYAAAKPLASGRPAPDAAGHFQVAGATPVVQAKTVTGSTTTEEQTVEMA